MSEPAFKIPNNWPCIFVCGATQSGKSHFINKFRGKKDAKVGTGNFSCTTEAQVYPVNEMRLNLIDTQGLGSASGKDMEYLQQNIDAIRGKNLSLILFVMRKGVLDMKI